jgi:hypothetical protein
MTMGALPDSTLAYTLSTSSRFVVIEVKAYCGRSPGSKSAVSQADSLEVQVSAQRTSTPPLTLNSSATWNLVGSVAPWEPRYTLATRVSLESLRIALLVAWMVVS